MYFHPGELSASQADALNRMWVFMEGVLRMRGSPPIVTEWYAGVPTIGLGEELGNGPKWLVITGALTNGTYPANIAILNSSTFAWANQAATVQVTGGNNETLVNGTRYLGCLAGPANSSTGNVANLPLYAVSVGGNSTTNITGSGLLGNVNLSGNLGNAGRVANLTLDANGVPSAGAGNFTFSFDTANVAYPANQRLALLTVGSSNVALPATPASSANHGWLTNTTQTVVGNKTFAPNASGNSTDGGINIVTTAIANQTSGNQLYVGPATGITLANGSPGALTGATVHIRRTLAVYASATDGNSSNANVGWAITAGQHCANDMLSAVTLMPITDPDMSNGSVYPGINFKLQTGANPYERGVGGTIFSDGAGKVSVKNRLIVCPFSNSGNGVYGVRTGNTTESWGVSGNDSIGNQFLGGIIIGLANTAGGTEDVTVDIDGGTDTTTLHFVSGLYTGRD